MVHYTWRLQRRLPESCQSNQSTWPLGTMALRLRLRVLMRLLFTTQVVADRSELESRLSTS